MDLPVALLWFLAGLLLILLEFAAPGVIVGFFGVGAWLVALTTWLGLTTSLPIQLLVWAIASVAMLLMLRGKLASRFHGFETSPQDPAVNLDEFSGAEVRVTTAIDPSHRDGRVEFKGAEWTAVSHEPIAEGRLAVIVRADGLTLHVRPVIAGASDSAAPGGDTEGE
jgi:membrane protein implicated in regulation of membrane protease activity